MDQIKRNVENFEFDYIDFFQFLARLEGYFIRGLLANKFGLIQIISTVKFAESFGRLIV